MTTDAKKAYQRQLTSPRWQKRRLEEMQRADFHCEACGSDRKELQVHHLRYTNDPHPAFVPPGYLEVLCSDCHEWREQWNYIFGRTLAPTRYYKQICENGLKALMQRDTCADIDFAESGYHSDLLISLVATMSRDVPKERIVSADIIAQRHLELAIKKYRAKHQDEVAALAKTLPRQATREV